MLGFESCFLRKAFSKHVFGLKSVFYLETFHKKSIKAHLLDAF
jgi:hypothetical protein